MWELLKSVLGVRDVAPRTRRDHSDEADNRRTTLRRPPRDSDEWLAEATRRWFELIPAHARPSLLAARHPRLANRIAELRGDPSRTLECLEALLVDERGGRAGFVPMIRAEIVRLGYLYRALLRESDSASLWSESSRTRRERASAWEAPVRKAVVERQAPRRAA